MRIQSLGDNWVRILYVTYHLPDYSVVFFAQQYMPGQFLWALAHPG